MQGSAHWLTIEEDGPGSKFIAYDKPGTTHLAHYGELKCCCLLHTPSVSVTPLLTETE